MASPSSDEECRQLILKAAAQCFGAEGPLRATVDDIARVASVHRTTVYKYFPNRPAIISAVLLWEARDVIAEAASFYEVPGSFAEQFARAYEHVHDGVRRSRVLRRLFDPDAVDAVVHATGASEEFRDLVSESLRPLVARAAACGELRGDLDIDEVLQWLGSIALLLLGESFRSDTFDAPTAMRRYVLPGITG
ncbi:MAG: TetR/AcrR family transcriptional regulator [Acidimicrobiales bacterium]